MTTDREHKIRERAYAIWLDQGCVDGRDEQHWREAEKEIDLEDSGANQQSAGLSSTTKPALSTKDLNASNDK